MKISDAVVVASFALGFGFFGLGLKVLGTALVVAGFAVAASFACSQTLGDR